MEYRDAQLKRVNARLLAGTALADGLSREYTLNEIAIVTRAGPARLLGLHHKGHLGVGADADVTVYARDPDIARMFATPRYVVKGGELVVEEGQLRRAPAGRRLRLSPGYDAAALSRCAPPLRDVRDGRLRQLPGAGTPRRAPGDRLTMQLRGVTIEDTFAEAFTMRVARVIITARNPRWAREAALKMTGFATSVIGCKVEAGIERELAESETPDGRPGISVLLLTMAKEDLGHRLIERVGQTVLTCPTTACFDGLPEAPDRVGVGSALRLFGDGFQGSKVIGGRRFWRIPVMEGEFLVEDKFGLQKGIGGGNFLILATDADAALAAAEAGVEAIATGPGSDSAVSRRHRPERQQGRGPAEQGDDRLHQRRLLPDAARGHRVGAAGGRAVGARDRGRRHGRRLRCPGRCGSGIDAACREGVVAITAANFGGKLGPHHFHLRQIMSGDGTR